MGKWGGGGRDGVVTETWFYELFEGVELLVSELIFFIAIMIFALS